MHSAQQSETSKNGKSAGLSPNGSSNTKQDQRHKRTSSNLTSTSNQNVNYTPRISIFGVVRRLLSRHPCISRPPHGLEAPPGHSALTYSKLCHGHPTCTADADRRRTCQMALGAVA